MSLSSITRHHSCAAVQLFEKHTEMCLVLTIRSRRLVYGETTGKMESISKSRDQIVDKNIHLLLIPSNVFCKACSFINNIKKKFKLESNADIRQYGQNLPVHAHAKTKNIK